MALLQRVRRSHAAVRGAAHHPTACLSYDNRVRLTAREVAYVKIPNKCSEKTVGNQQIMQKRGADRGDIQHLSSPQPIYL
jgi:hypothetical protein